MQSKNYGLILYTKLIKDNDLYIKILSSNDKSISGVVYGGNSTKKRRIYQPGYFIEFNQLRKNYNSINSINAEITQPYMIDIYDDKYKLFSLSAMISILNISVFEEIQIEGLFTSVKNLIRSINSNKHWLCDFCIWLLYFLKLLGYEIDYMNRNNMKYFNFNSLNLQKIYTNDSLTFPHEFLKNHGVITHESVKSLFEIFEIVFKKNLLDHHNNKMPINYLNFKNLILDKINK